MEKLLEGVTLHTTEPPQRMTYNAWKRRFKVGSKFSYMDGQEELTVDQIVRKALIEAAQKTLKQNYYEQVRQTMG